MTNKSKGSGVFVDRLGRLEPTSPSPKRRGSGSVANAIHVIVPYRHASTWVFDDPRVGLSQEPFVSGIPEMIDTMVANIPNAEKGFRPLLSKISS
jgi:hypothetical protein